MNEIEEIKRRKMEQMQKQYQDQMQKQIEEEQQAQQQIAALEELVRARLSKEALQRYGNVKAANPERTIQLLVVLGRLIQLGKVGMISDETLISVLQRMPTEKRQTTIIRK